MLSGSKFGNVIPLRFFVVSMISRLVPRCISRGLRRRLFQQKDKGTARDIPNIPLQFEALAYRVNNPDVVTLSDSELWLHYQNHGRQEGRRCHQLPDRQAFLKIIPSEMQTLEIGPYARPLVTGSSVKYVDVFSTEELRQRADGVEMKPEHVPEITWVSQPSDLSCVDEYFGAVLSSHSIEHQPNLVNHLNQVDHILRRGGRYFVLVPDHRYCFDHFMTPSLITDVLAAHVEKRKTHTVESLLESRLLMTHNDPVAHWSDNHGNRNDNPEYPNSNRIERLQIGMDSYQEQGFVKDEHAWYFTPETFESIINDLNKLGLINLKIERMYPTMRNSLEFWVILRNKSN